MKRSGCVKRRLRTEWKLAEGDVYDNTYIHKYLTTHNDLLPASFGRANVQTIQNCLDALMHVRLIVDPAQRHVPPRTEERPLRRTARAFEIGAENRLHPARLRCVSFDNVASLAAYLAA